MSDKLKIQQEPNNQGRNNVLVVPPRRKTVTHKGMFGIIEFHPVKKCWSYVVKFVYTITHKGGDMSEAEATLEVKKLIDTAAKGSNKSVRTIE